MSGSVYAKQSKHLHFILRLIFDTCIYMKKIIQVIGAATQCALSTSQLVACAKVVAPTISDPLCQEQLMEAAKEVAKSVEGCVSTCKDVSKDGPSLNELRSSAQDVTRALNDLLNHVKDGHSDKIPDIMEQIMVASGELIASYDSGEMVRQARILAQSTTELIQAIKGEAETQSDSDLQVRNFPDNDNIYSSMLWKNEWASL